MTHLHAISKKQRAMLAVLKRGPVKTIIELVRAADGYARPGAPRRERGHWAGYARVHRLRRRGLIKINGGVSLTTAGRRIA